MQRVVFSIILCIVAACPMLPQQYKQLTDVPTIYIETEDGKDIVSKEQYINCTLIYADSGKSTSYKNTQIRGRGNSSWWNSPKKPYRIKFDKKQLLLGDDFANAKSWTLLANHGDKTMIRNALTYDLGRFMGMKFCPGAKFADLYLNGQYRGTYQISDQVQVHKKRVDINEDDGWFLEVVNENSQEEPLITSTRYGIMYNIKNPEDDMLTVNKRIAIGQWIEKFEAAVASVDFCDSERGYRACVDEEDLVNWYVGAEITGNIDALYSIYMYKDAGEEKMHFGPLWDLDMGYDNSSEKSLLRDMEAYLGLWNRPFEKIVQRMWQDPWFARSCNDRLNELIDNGLEQYLLTHIDSLRNSIYQSQQQNFKIWGIDEKVYDWEKHVYHKRYDEYITDLKNFVKVHIPYLQQAFRTLCQETYIQEVNADDFMASPYYNLNGQCVKNPQRGIYVRKGKKFLFN